MPIRLLVASLVLGVAACAQPQRDARPLVAVSVPPQKFVVDRIAGELVRVEVLVPPGANPTTHEPTLAQLSALRETALFVVVGHRALPFERAWLDPILAEAPGVPVVDASAGLSIADGDPHLWVSPRHLEHMAVRVEAALAELLPAHRERLAANLASLRADIAALDTELRRQLAPLRGRSFLVFHPAWGHFAAEYGLEQVAIERDHKEPDPHALAELIARARAEGVRVVFVQPQFDAASARTLAREIGARVETLDPLAYDWDANLRRAALAISAAGPG